MFKFRLFLFFSMITWPACIHSQELHSAFEVKNSHLWRGIEVAAGLVGTGDLHLDYKSVYAGFWGGGTSDGSYKEFDNYIGYKSKHFRFELWDIYNFSPGAHYNNKEFFNYKTGETGRFGDLRSYYTISDKFPLILSWNTVVYGRDRNAANTENKYSTFVFTEYPFYKKEDIEVRGRIGYSFALNNTDGETSNFFCKRAGFNEISLIVSKQLKIRDYKIPVGIWAMWNPVDNHAFLQFSAQVYSF